MNSLQYKKSNSKLWKNLVFTKSDIVNLGFNTSVLVKLSCFGYFSGSLLKMVWMHC